MVTHDESTCPDCGGVLKYYDSVPRIVRTKRRSTSWIKVRRLRCIKCGHLHRELPDDIFPYKQYEAEIIRGVIEGLITCETIGYEDGGFNLLFLRAQERYLNDLAKSRGYIYLNQIYEVLGVCWNPENENECLKYDKNYIVQFQFEVFHESDSSLRIFILLSKNES